MLEPATGPEGSEYRASSEVEILDEVPALHRRVAAAAFDGAHQELPALLGRREVRRGHRAFDGSRDRSASREEPLVTPFRIGDSILTSVVGQKSLRIENAEAPGSQGATSTHIGDM
jgi:hypothetical protein